MRLWHKDFISCLPRQQLLSQWRECCCIAKNIADNGTPNHLLVNKVLNYPISHFNFYTKSVINEMENRGYKVNKAAIDKFYSNLATCSMKGYFSNSSFGDDTTLFVGWHNDRYLVQCYHNLEEKFDCGGITSKEFEAIKSKFHNLIKNKI